MPAICQDCAAEYEEARAACTMCGSSRIVTHAELQTLHLAHLDCDSFYATVEKRDDPSLQAKPVIVGGGRRGVVAACCYIARIDGVHSAMPMHEARRRCPDAVVIRPDMEKYAVAGRAVRELMLETTPLVEPLSIDEAFLDLGGTEALHGGAPVRTLVRLVNRIESEVGITASVGLSFNKFLAKLASDLDKPRGLSVIGRAEAPAFLADRPVGMMWGVGKALRQRLKNDGITRMGQLRAHSEADLVRRYGIIGQRLHKFSRGEDDRPVDPTSRPKSISAETTFERDIKDPEKLKRVLWPLAEKVSKRLKNKDLAGGGVTLKLKRSDFRQFTRSRALTAPTQMAEEIYREALTLLEAEADGTWFRLIGVGVASLCAPDQADLPDLIDPEKGRRRRVEEAMDQVRGKFGSKAIGKGRSLD